MINIKQLIELQNNIPTGMVISGAKKNTKLMFHKVDAKRVDINPKFNLLNFETFQKEHWNSIFTGTDYILSFWYEGKTARFLGCYELGRPTKDKIIDEMGKTKDRIIFHDMHKIDFLSEYIDRLFIIWTNPSANYGRWIDEGKYEIHSIKPSADNSIGNMPMDYFKIRLEYKKIQKLFEFPLDNHEWHLYLSSRCGVYLIYDVKTKEQYIGSASGEEGFWGRWSDYAQKKDGNKDFQDRDYDNLQFSILWETILSTPKEKILEVEKEFKNNLGTRVHGLNNN